MHDFFIKNPVEMMKQENQISMTTLVYYYFIDGQVNNLFQLLKNTDNIEFLAIRLLAYL